MAAINIILYLVLKVVFTFCILLIGYLIFLLGQWIFGLKREGGSRLVLFCSGVVLLAIGTGMMFAVFWPGHLSQNYLWALLLLLAVGLCLLGMALMGVGIMGSNERVRAWMDKLLNG